MRFVVTALPQADFEAWRAEQTLLTPPGSSAGRAVFLRECAACHRVRGTEAGGIYGPDLTHFASRPTIAAGVLANDRENLERWIAHTQQIKPGALMPDVSLSNEDRAAVATYLEGLE